MIFFKFVWLSGRISDVSPAKSAKHLPQWFGSRRLAEAHFEVWKARQWLMGGLFGNTVCSFQLRKFLLPSPNSSFISLFPSCSLVISTLLSSSLYSSAFFLGFPAVSSRSCLWLGCWWLFCVFFLHLSNPCWS